MRRKESAPVRRADYRPPPYRIERIALAIDLDFDRTEVDATLSLRRDEAADAAAPLELDAEQLDLTSVELDGRRLAPAAYRLRDDALVLDAPPAAAFTLRIRNTIVPRANSALMGLYVSNDTLFTQCEAEGQRRIFPCLDRPDVLARYTVVLRADRDRFPVLLSNGNLVEQGSLPDGRHFARWDDPFPKPGYLFALVAGRLACRDTRIRTGSGREVLLQTWSAPADLDRLEHACACLQRAIAWDERRFGRELDLDRYMLVATADFNMGAMENKGLNVFNSKYVLADPSIATDADYANIESIVGHEYFHNWSGNRVTCRDWFQLSLKEGLTVFRDQEFTRDSLEQSALDAGADPASARAIARIDDVQRLRTVQFPEDAGPMAHPVRPDAYLEISNFYTPTVYEKGAEVVRMLQTLTGVDTFRRGLDLYFARHDGQAATCDDLVAAVAEAAQRDLTQFVRWYSQAGTPRIAVGRLYDPQTRSLELSFAQSCPPTPGQPDKEPLLVPFALGLLGPDGAELPLQLEGEPAATAGTRVLELTQPSQTFRFVGVEPGAVPSLLRDFSAPAIVEHAYEDAELMLLAAHDSDGFNRWEAGQRLLLARLLAAADAIEAQQEAGPPAGAVDAARAPAPGETLHAPGSIDEARALEPVETVLALVRHTLRDESLAPALRERALQLPGEAIVAEQRAIVDPEAIRTAHQALRRLLGQRLALDWLNAYRHHAGPGAYAPDPVSAGRRGLKNLALAYLVDGGDRGALDLARRQLAAADNLTDRYAALAAIVHSEAGFKAEVLLLAAREWHTEPLLMNKWLALQASAPAHAGEPPVLERVRILMRHAAYSESNPNSVHALVLGFCNNNPAEFHRRDGSGYVFWVDQVLRLDRINPIVAARIARSLERWRRFTPDRRRMMREALEQVARAKTLSRDVREIVGRALAP